MDWKSSILIVFRMAPPLGRPAMRMMWSTPPLPTLRVVPVPVDVDVDVDVDDFDAHRLYVRREGYVAFNNTI